MKCPKCSGAGYIYNNLVGYAEGCSVCHGKGEVQTNEEWLRSATFEELAGAIYEWHTKGYTKGRLELELNPITEIVAWLKEIHE